MIREISLIAAACLALGACSPKRYAIRQLGGALAGLGTSLASDPDPELVRDAVPFSLKLIETLLAESPKDPQLLLAATKGFGQYSYAFVLLEADELEEKDKAAAQAARTRASKLFLRARDYGMRGLELNHPNFRETLKADPKSAVAALKPAEVPFIYWTALSWAAALAASRDMFMLPQIPQFDALIDRALELDEDWDKGAIHTFLILYEMTSPTRKGDKAARAKQHFDRAVELSQGRQAGPFLAYAENVLVPAKDRAGFEATLKRAIAVDVNADPESRVQNLVAQRRARWLLGRTAKLFPSTP